MLNYIDCSFGSGMPVGEIQHTIEGEIYLCEPGLFTNIL